MGASCSQSAKTSGITILDSSATQACAGLAKVLRDRAAGSLSAADLRSRVGEIYSAAQASGNPLIRARAFALFADVTVMVTGGEAGALDVHLAAMDRVCKGNGG
jgi:hypothetical protein